MVCFYRATITSIVVDLRCRCSRISCVPNWWTETA